MASRERERAERMRRYDAELRRALEERRLPRPRRAEVADDGTLPAPVRVLVDDGQLRRARTLLVNLTGLDEAEAAARIAAARRAP